MNTKQLLDRHKQKRLSFLHRFLIITTVTVFQLFAALSYAQSDIPISGKVTGSSGEGIPGVSITVKGTTFGTSTNSQGMFSLTAADNGVLVISAVGFTTQEVEVSGRSTINIQLAGSAAQLEQVVVVGYGTQRKVDVTGSVASVNGAEIAKQVAVNPVSALQGKVAGVTITNAGSPGASPQIRIRGLGTVFGNPNPLFVVDGVWFDDISFLNPADIDNISILKDASSQSIYGVRAANGVVLVTTKRGRGRAVINYNGYMGVQRVTNLVEMANATEYATLINEKNRAQTFANPQSFGVGTNWFDVVLRPALISNHHVSVGGSGDKMSYNFSLGFTKQEGLVENNDYTRVTARLQSEFQAAAPLKIGYNAILEGSNSNDAAGAVIYKAFTAAPVVPVRYNDGSYGDPADFPIGSATNNPQAQLDFFNQKSKTYRVTGNLYGELTFARNFTFRSSFGGEFAEGESRNYTPVYMANTIQFANVSKLSMSRSQTRNWIIENTLTYDKNFGSHRFRALAGQTAQRYKFYKLSGSADNVPESTTDDYFLNVGSQTGRTVTDEGALDTYNSYFGRINYSFKNKYLLNASVRADGSSKFFDDNRWGVFPSVGAGWVISDEGFMDNQKTFNMLKLRGSYGVVGNARVPANISILRVSTGGNLVAVFGNQPYTGASINTIVPPTTYWEKGVGIDVGLEGALANNRFTFEIDWYNRETVDGIFNAPILGSLGTSGSVILQNQASFRNRGWEFSFGWRDNPSQAVTYNLNLNFSVNDNEVTEVITGNNPVYGGGAAATGGQLSTRTILGHPIGQFFGLQVDGIFQTQAEVTGSNQPNARPGDFRYKDMNGDKIIDAKDRVVLGNPIPRYTFGFNSNVSYRQFDFTLDLQGVADVDIYNANKGLRFGSENFSKDFFDNRWHGAGTSNTYPSADVGGGSNYLPNSWFVEDGSYLRVRNIQLGYTLPSSMVNGWGLQRIRLYVNAQNALNFFKYTGFTPEVSGSDPLSSGIDNGVYPLSATYNFGLNVTF